MNDTRRRRFYENLIWKNAYKHMASVWENVELFCLVFTHSAIQVRVIFINCAIRHNTYITQGDIS